MTPVWRVLAASFALLAVLVVCFLMDRSSDSSLPVVAPPEAVSNLSPMDRDQEPSATPSASSTEPPLAEMPPPQIPTAIEPRRSNPGTSVLSLEQQIRGTRGADERADLIGELAHDDSPDAVLALERLFTIERHPKVQTAIIADLMDVDPAIRPDARMRILRAALVNQPREVRSTAVEVLAESRDPAALELLRKTSISDPDHEVREAAAALYQANGR
jgi:hypothetical protein